MTAVQPELWPEGWDLEPCGDADERAFVDLHGPQPVRRRLTRRDLKWLGDFETVPISIDQFRKGALMPGPPRQPLTRRQAEVLEAAADGATLAVVAVRVGIPREQVAARLSEAYRRLGVAWMDRGDRRAAAVRVARRRGLLPSEGPQQAREGAQAPV